MTARELEDAVHAFFASYRRSFERFDTSAIADHFAFPAHVTADAREVGLTAVPDRQAWLDALGRLIAMYRAIDVTSAHILDLRLTPLSERLVQALVTWRLQDRGGHRLYDFEASYTLAAIGDAFRIVAIAHNEMPRYRECDARLRGASSTASEAKRD